MAHILSTIRRFSLRRKTPARAPSEPGNHRSVAERMLPGLSAFIEEVTVELVLAAVCMVSVSV